jgi:tyrosine-protein phosphatase YwqE
VIDTRTAIHNEDGTAWKDWSICQLPRAANQAVIEILFVAAIPVIAHAQTYPT